MPKIGLIVNPLAGIGGRLALKGSDDRALVEAALAAGAVPVAAERHAGGARRDPPGATILAAGGAMGADLAGTAVTGAGAARRPTTRAPPRSRSSTAGVDLLLFAGGDGTAVDILDAVGDRVPVIGIPAGVKMHSAVFGVTPRRAGELAARSWPAACAARAGRGDGRRRGRPARRHHLAAPARVPAGAGRAGAGAGRQGAHGAGRGGGAGSIAAHVVERLLGDGPVLVGPGTTTAAIMAALGLRKSVLGVDVIATDGWLRRRRGGGAAAVRHACRAHRADTGRRPGLPARPGQPAAVAAGAAGGRRRPAVVVATAAKLAALGGRPLLVDTGDAALDAELAGFRRIVTAYGRETVHRVGLSGGAPSSGTTHALGLTATAGRETNRAVA